MGPSGLVYTSDTLRWRTEQDRSAVGRGRQRCPHHLPGGRNVPGFLRHLDAVRDHHSECARFDSDFENLLAGRSEQRRAIQFRGFAVE